MEKRGFCLETTSPFPTVPVYVYNFSDFKTEGEGKHENEYIALWLAIREAVKNDS
jgi:hypothetical protein